MSEGQSLRLRAEELAEQYAALEAVEAVVLGGSLAAGLDDAVSDLDLYVYTTADLPRRSRAAIAMMDADLAEVDNRFWEPGDEWLEQGEQLQVDVMFRSTDWIAERLEEVLVHHRAALGYTTCLWHNVLTSRLLFDRGGWFGQLQGWAAQRYPEPLRRAIVARNHPILARTLSSYSRQLEKALMRRDLVSLNHRTAAFLASYFDLLFALNRRPHPGEKRLLAQVERCCPLRPLGLGERVEDLLRAAGQGEARVVELAEDLAGALTTLLEGEGLLRH